MRKIRAVVLIPLKDNDGRGFMEERAFYLNAEVMMNREEAERQIRELIATETRAVVLSNKLFTPDGLFNEIAHNEQDRREVVKTQLWRDAQSRLRELEHREADALNEATKILAERLPLGRYRIRMEPIDTN